MGLQQAAHHAQCFHGIWSQNCQMHRLFTQIKKAAKVDVSIFVSGETGVGKELVARALHAESQRSAAPFVAVSVANLSSELIDAQLFGYKKGAFTGALHDSQGLLHMAHKGTLFLDEVTSLQPNNQVKFLRVLQEKQYYPVGDYGNLREFKAAVISASNLSLEEASEQSQFREDLRYRLEVIHLYVPPLRERKEDIMLLFQKFLERASGTDKWVIPPAIEAELENHCWLGNVRELENCASYVAAMAVDYLLQKSDLPDSIGSKRLVSQYDEGVVDQVGNKTISAGTIEQALYQCHGNRSNAARFLGVSRMTLWRKMKMYNLS
ncbi:MAG: sigma-54 dependent transcriptional regulator [Gammaproteobacteria bacterium]|nr:sigma-54 dependent transcriptional regulator [Gammaproteobacteria bacterium]